MQNIFKYTALLAFLLIINACTGLKVDQDEIKEANQFFESIFQDRVLDSPEFQSRLGYKSNYDQWDDISWPKRRDDARNAVYDLDYLRNNVDIQKLDEKTAISYRLMEKSLQRIIDADEYLFRSYLITHRGGRHSSIPSFLINYHAIDSERDIKAIGIDSICLLKPNCPVVSIA